MVYAAKTGQGFKLQLRREVTVQPQAAGKALIIGFFPKAIALGAIQLQPAPMLGIQSTAHGHQATLPAIAT